MGFHYGQYSLPGLVAEIAAELDATSDFAIIDSEVTGGYALRYKDQNLYLMIEAVTNGDYGKSYSSSGTYYAKFSGIGMRFSSDWDTANHVPAGTIRRYAFAPLFCNTTTPSTARLGLDSTFQVNYWVDKYGLIGVIQNPYADNYASGAFFALEFVPDTSKEFSDGFTNVMAFTKRNYDYWYNGSSNYPSEDSEAYYYHALRPFDAETGLTLIKEDEITLGYRSLGNSKVYFEFATTFNERVNWRTPIFQTKRWFFVREDSGLSLNDVVSWLDVDQVTVHKFFITAAISPDVSTKVIVGIPYENAYQY